MNQEQIDKLRSIFNRALCVLRPNLKPDDSFDGFTHEELRLIAGALGSEVSARQVEAYVKLEQKKWKTESKRIGLLNALMAVVEREIELLEFYNEKNRQTECPLPSTVTVVNTDSSAPGKEIPMEEFLQMLRNISASSIFKR